MAALASRFGTRTLTILGVFCASLALLGGLSVLDAQLEAFERAVARPAFGPLPASQEGLERFAGATADRCVFAGPDRKLCRWQVEGRLVRANELGGVGDGSKVNLVCELPTDASASGACQAHAIDETRLPAVSAAPSPGDAFASYATITALSHALGDVPDRCITGAGSQACTWLLDGGEAGIGRLEGDADDAILRCLLPLDGRARADGSCEVLAPEL
jgi:hypothetical protein